MTGMNGLFWTQDDMPVPAVTAGQMREVDRIAVEEFGLGIVQMMENAGRTLAAHVLQMDGGVGGKVTVPGGGTAETVSESAAG